MMALLNAQGRFALTAFSPLLFNIALIAVVAALLGWRQDAGRCRDDPRRHGRHRRSVAIVDPAFLRGGNIANTAADLVRRRRCAAFSVKRDPRHDREQRAAMADGGRRRSSHPPRPRRCPGSISPTACSNCRSALSASPWAPVLMPEMTRARAERGSRSDRACRIARPRTRGRTGVAGDAGPDRAERADRAECCSSTAPSRPADSAATAQALVWLALGLPAHVLVKALSPAFLRARGHASRRCLATLKAIAVAIVSGVLLGHWFGARGIAAAIALGAWSNALRLIRAGAATFGFSIDAAARRRLPRIVASGAGDGRRCSGCATGFVPIAGMHAVAQAIALADPDCRRQSRFTACSWRLFGVTGWREVVNAIRQNRAA